MTTPVFKDFDQLVEDMMMNLHSQGTGITDMNPGSRIRCILEVVAAQLDAGYYMAEQILKLFFAATTVGEYLDLRVKERGLSRYEGSRASGAITLSRSTPAPFGQLIPKGTTFETEDHAVQVKTTYSATLAQGSTSVTVPVKATDIGSSGNLQAGTVLQQTGIAVGLIEMAEVSGSGLTGGTDIETDDTLRSNYLDVVRSPATSGNGYHYRQWALEVSGVGDVKVFSEWNGPLTVKVVIADSSHQPASAALISEVAQHIETVRPIGATVTVVSAVAKPVNVAATVVLESGYTLQQVTSFVSSEIQKYLKETSFSAAYISYAKIGAILLAVSGIGDYSALTLNDAEENIVLADAEVPVLGTVDLGVSA